MTFGIRDPPMASGVLAALAFYGASWGWWGHSEHSESWLSPWANAVMVVTFTLIGLTILLFILLETARSRIANKKPLQVAFIGFLLGMVMVAVVQNEPGNFYSVSAGVMASLILALAAGSMR